MITSKSNETIKYAQKIKEKKYSRLEGKCLVESLKLIRELYHSGLIETILATQEKLPKLGKIPTQHIETISENIAEYLSNASTTDGVFGICKIPSVESQNYHRCVVLDSIQDPSNLGAIIRSAKAFGFDTILALDSVYPYTFKGIRASMGHIFDVNFFEVDFEQLKLIKNKENIQFVVADMNGEDVSHFSPSQDNLAIVIGNEGSGISEQLLQISDRVISIPMNECVESLNASVSAGIIMYLLK